MPPDDQRAIARLDEALDRAVSDDRAALYVPSDTDDLVGAHRQVQALDRTPGPDSRFVRQLMEDLMSTNVPVLGTNRLLAPPARAPRGLVPKPRSVPLFPSGRRWERTQLAAALLLLALASAYLALGPLRPDRPPGRTLPAAFVPATPSLPPGVLADETVLTLTIPGDALPGGDDLLTAITHYSIPPGTRSTWTDDCCPGPHVEFVMSGAYTVRVQVPIRVYRANGGMEEIPTNTEVTLGPGDALLSRQEATMAAANSGVEPVELLDWGLVGNGVFAGPYQLAGWTMHNSSNLESPSNLAPTPVQLRLRRLTLAADAILTPSIGSFVSLAVSAEPHTSLGRRSDGSFRNTGATPVTVYLVTLDQQSAGTPVAVSPTPTAATPTP
jgi:hypothetical protein